MTGSRLAGIVAACYVLVAASLLAYELSIRIFDRGNSAFAGMLSIALSLPMSLLVIAVAKAAFAVNPGDSDAVFVVTLGLSAVANASLLWMILRMLSGTAFKAAANKDRED